MVCHRLGRIDIVVDILAWIVAPIVVLAASAITKMVWDMRATVARDEERWARQEELWQQNAEEHERAFSQISILKDGQRRIEAKLDLLLGKNNG